MRIVSSPKVFLIALLVVLATTVVSAFAAANSVTPTLMGEFSNTIPISDLVPVECKSLGITRVEVIATGQTRGSGANTLYIGTPGDDNITGKNGSDCLVGGGGNDFLDGGQGDDILIGGDGNDSLDGKQGFDICYGGSGSNTYSRCESIP